jgi:general secretion pathway protein K
LGRIRHQRGAEAGIALIIVMISITVLAILAAGFAYSMKVETKLARNANNEEELAWLGRSGVEYCRWVLAQQMNIPQEPYDALNQVWAGGQGGIGTSNSPLADVQRDVPLGNGHFTWEIKDMERKANINTAGQGLLEQALTLMGVDAGDFTPIVNSILDWTDGSSKHPRIQGAKDEYYGSLDPPYSAKNGPIDDISELLYIKGVTPELYFGGAVADHPQGRFQPRNTRFGQQPGDAPAFTAGLVDLFTPMSNGKINLNTASAEVLQLIPGVDSIVANAIVGARGGEDDGSGLTGPYRSVNDVRRVPEVSLQAQRSIQQFCDVRSKVFEATITAQVGGSTRHFVGILGRNSARSVDILNFYWKE